VTHFSACATLVGAAPSASIPVEMIRTAGSPRLMDLAKEAGPHIDYFPARFLCINTIANCVSVMWGHLSISRNELALFGSNASVSTFGVSARRSSIRWHRPAHPCPHAASGIIGRKKAGMISGETVSYAYFTHHDAAA
jgi:hypothetical protein